MSKQIFSIDEKFEIRKLLVDALKSAKSEVDNHNTPSQETKDFMRITEERWKNVATNQGVENAMLKVTKTILEDSEKRFISKVEFEPIRKVYDRITSASFGALVLVGTLVVAAWAYIKSISK